MNQEDIKKILNDLYAVDPTLRRREGELVSIIRVMAVKPDAHYDPAFAARLRSQILAELARNGAPARGGVFASFFAGRSFRYAALGVAVVAIAIVSVAAYGNPFSKQNGPDQGLLALNSGSADITSVGANAFGSLQSLSGTSGEGSNVAGNSAADATAPAASAPSTTSPRATAAPMMSAAASGGGEASAGVASPGVIAMPIRPMPYPGVKYVYVGDPITQDKAQLDVLKKIAVPLSADQVTAALEHAGFGPVNLSTFDGLSLQNVTLAQNQSFGYEISLDLVNGTMSISENYNQWPQETFAAPAVPPDSTVISIANDFLREHDISTDGYGAPKVMHAENYAVPMAKSATAAMPMIPYYSGVEEVLYPRLINGMAVYGASGNPIGLTVNVNLRYNRVQNVYGLQTERFQSSAYDAITNTSTILSMAENPEIYPIIYGGVMEGGTANSAGDTAVTTIKLGTPTMVYEDMYRSDNKGASSEFLVPAFAFPILGNASDTAPTRYIIVPLIKDFEQQQGGGIMPRPMPMPITNPAAQ